VSWSKKIIAEADHEKVRYRLRRGDRPSASRPRPTPRLRAPTPQLSVRTRFYRFLRNPPGLRQDPGRKDDTLPSCGRRGSADAAFRHAAGPAVRLDLSTGADLLLNKKREENPMTSASDQILVGATPARAKEPPRIRRARTPRGRVRTNRASPGSPTLFDPRPCRSLASWPRLRGRAGQRTGGAPAAAVGLEVARPAAIPASPGHTSIACRLAKARQGRGSNKVGDSRRGAMSRDCDREASPRAGSSASLLLAAWAPTGSDPMPTSSDVLFAFLCSAEISPVERSEAAGRGRLRVEMAAIRRTSAVREGKKCRSCRPGSCRRPGGPQESIRTPGPDRKLRLGARTSASRLGLDALGACPAASESIGLSRGRPGDYFLCPRLTRRAVVSLAILARSASCGRRSAPGSAPAGRGGGRRR